MIEISIKTDNMLVNDILVKLIMLTPIAMLLQRSVDSANRILVGGILLFLVLVVVRDGNVDKKTFANILIAMLIFVYSLLNINEKYFSINMLFYFPIWAFYLRYIVDSHERMMAAFQENEQFATIIIWVWSLLVIVSFFLPSSYTTNGEFQSFANGNFRFAPTVFFMATLIWSYAGIFKKKKYMFFLAVPFAAMVATGSRTYTIILLILMALAFYNFFECKVHFALLMVPCLLLVLYILSRSAFFVKFESVMNNPYVSDPLAAFTSNRSVFWAGELKMFNEAGILEKLLGGGLTSSYVKNVQISGQAIWAHNDFLEVLNAHGLIGLIIYMKLFVDAFASLNSRYMYSKLQKLTFLLCCMLNALFNGLYVYTTATLAIPFLACAVTVDFSRMDTGTEVDNEFLGKIA